MDDESVTKKGLLRQGGEEEVSNHIQECSSLTFEIVNYADKNLYTCSSLT